MKRDLDISLLRTFSTIALTGSFTATSHQLLRTQPAISLRLKRLEDIIGVPLVARGTEGLSLTREGNLVLGYAKRILSLNDELVRRMQVAETSEVVRIGLPEEYAAIGLEKILKFFAADYPSAMLNIDVRLSSDLDTCLQEGRLDLILGTHLTEPATGSLRRKVPVAWIASEQLALVPHREFRLILPSEGNLYRRLALTALAKGGVKWDIACTAANWTTVRSAVLAGIGITVAPMDMIAPGMRSVGREDGLPPLPEIWISLTCRARMPSLAIRGLMDLLAAGLFENETGTESCPSQSTA